ncbi:helix-turn-helix transcriptional regulator [Arcobacter vandammei]|uniref:helix-turn-helix transcriptional regulator n=1 Tax=Arcobacter vandammei TaxID=2782243 RepID=UPI0018DF78CB|nr:LuxR C-terminal-related transcriptional regulator [Arcobacter vandammei]
MKIFCFSRDINLLTRWGNILKNSYEIVVLEDEKDILNLENSIFIFSSCSSIKFSTIKELKSKNNKILVLERVPTLQNAKLWLAQKVDGYGNSLMNLVFFKSSIESIKTNHIWLLPKIATELFRDISDYKIDDSKNSILENLTNSEKRVAYLLKDGYKNQEICEELNITINTVKKHIKNIYDKLNIQDRAAFMKLFL